MQRSNVFFFQIEKASLSDITLSDRWGFDMHVSDFSILPDSYKHLHLRTIKYGRTI